MIFFKRKIDILSFTWFSCFPINRMLCFLFYYNTETPKYKRKELTLKGITILLS